MTQEIFDPQPSGISCFLATVSSNFITQERATSLSCRSSGDKGIEPSATRPFNHMFLILQRGADGPDDLVKSHARGISRGTHIAASRLASRSDTCIHSRKLFKVAQGKPYKQQAVDITKEAALCSHCTLDSGEERLNCLQPSPFFFQCFH